MAINIFNDSNNLKMKLGKLFLLTLALFAFAMTSCGDDDDDNDCIRCELSAPLVSDCEIDVCPDGTATSNGELLCAGGEVAISLLNTQDEIVDALESAGYSCN